MGSSENGIQPKSLKQSVNKIYKRQWLEGVLFGWIRAQKTLIASITIEQSILSFYKDLDITESDFPMADCYSTFMRMSKEFLDSQKTVQD